MTTLASWTMLGSAAIVGTLGLLHLVHTFRGSRLAPRDPAVQQAMERSHPGITRQTTMWRAWIGFNASHAMGAMLFAAVWGYLALVEPLLLQRSTFLQALGAAMLAGLLVLARLYWFRVPLMGVALSLALYGAALLMHR